MRDWREYKGQITGAVREIGTSDPELVKAYAQFHHATSASKHLDTKTRELIALAVAVTLRCDGCINAHSEAAVRAGATKDEVTEALGVAVMVNAGATMVYSAHVVDAFNTYSQPAPAKSETTS
ncbi:MAG: carboxymuconolactone decarboxylase family protein [Proteobacteria bacterium]|nr:carboxymuconolactone decarboxylase family protein [Pseudomonadota bacterium]